LKKVDYANRLKGILEDIDGIEKVTFMLLTREQVSDKPSISIQFGPSNRTKHNESGAGNYLVDQSYVVIGYLKTDTDVDQEGLLTIAAFDLQEKIANAVLGSNTNKVETLLVQTEEPFLDYKNNYAEVALVVAVQFIHNSLT
jgi:hypothetical protein